MSDRNIRADYERLRPQITGLLAATEWWHGTGTKKYALLGRSKFEGTSTAVEDVLPRLLQGLEPRRDAHVEVAREGRRIDTVSLTRNRMCARMYALRHFCQGQRLEFEYGSDLFWSQCITGRMWTEALTHRVGWRLIAAWLANSGRRVLDRDYRRACRLRAETRARERLLWPSDIRRDGQDLFWSDIDGNTPVLIGIRRGCVRPIAFGSPGLALFESRTDAGVPRSAFTYLEVPLACIDVVRRQVAALEGADRLAVVPIEYVELVQSESEFESLVKPDRAAAVAAFESQRTLPH